MGLRRAGGGASRVADAARAVPRLAPRLVCRSPLLRNCRALPGPGADLWASRGPSQGRRVRHGAETGPGARGYWRGLRRAVKKGVLTKEGAGGARRQRITGPKLSPGRFG